MRKSYNRPKNEQDFEVLCLKLLQIHWECPELSTYATKGQIQNGVDIIDLSGQEPLRAVQCKLHEEGKMITQAEIGEEIEKAKKFKFPLGLYVIMTTSKAGKEIHDLMIKTNREHRRKGLFKVEVFDWLRIEELLEEHPDVCDWYEGGAPFDVSKRIESKVDELLERSTPGRGNHNEDGFHAEIDEARDFLEKHDHQMAKLLLQRIKVRSWDELTPRHKFRVLTNLAAVEASIGNLKDTADLYIEAKKYQPTDETAQTNEALGYLLLEQRNRAFELSQELRKEFPRSERVVGVFIQSAPDSMTLEQLKDFVPEDLLEKDEVAVPLTRRALNSGDLRRAEEFIKAAVDAESRASETWLHLGQIVLQMEISKNVERYGVKDLFCNEKKLLEAEDALGKAIAFAKENHSVFGEVEALLTRQRVRRALGKNAEAREDLEEARRIAPQNTLVIEAYSGSLHSEEKLDEAIDLMRSIPSEALSYQGQMIFGLMLMERGDPGDYSDAGDLFSQLVKSEAKLREDFREEAIELGLQAFAREKQFDACHKLMKEVSAGRVSDVNFKTLTAKLHLLEGQNDKASNCADDALALTNDATTVFEIRRLALLLFELERFGDALLLWQRIAVPNAYSSDTVHLLQCADQLNKHGIMLDIFEKLRQAGATDRNLLYKELSLLEQYDTDKAIKILDEEISRRPGDKELKLGRSWMGLALDKPELIDQDPSSLPEPDQVNPQMALKAVRVLKAIGQESLAIQYAYEVLHGNFDDPDAHKAFTAIILEVHEGEPKLENPECVKTGVVVSYVEKGDSFIHQVVVEDTPNPDSNFPERELSPDNEICRAMMGKKVGETFVLAQGIQNRIGEITKIENKYVHRFQDCIGQWQIRFPKLQDMQLVRIPQDTGESGEQEPDMSTILKCVDDQHESMLNLQQIYKENPLPLHLFVKNFDKNAFEALLHLANSKDVFVKCCSDSNEECDQAAKALESCNTVVLDMSAISSLFLLDRPDILKGWPIDIVVSRNTVNELRQMVVNEELVRKNVAGVLLKTDAGHTFVENTAEQQADHLSKLHQLVGAIEDNCKVEPCQALAELDPQKREILIDVFGQYGAESILLAATVPKAVLWTDDFAQAGLARSEHGVSRVWTQLVIRRLVESGVVKPEVFFDASAKLFGYGYYFTGQNADIIRHAGIIAEWKIDRWPFSQTLSTFADEDLNLMQVLQLAGGFIRLLYQESLLPESRNTIMVKILENIAKKEGGVQGVRYLLGALPAIFGVNVIGLARATETISLWLKEISNRPFRL